MAEKRAKRDRGDSSGYVGAPYVKGSDTSREAAVNQVTSGRRASDEMKVLRFIAKRGERGSLDDETECALRMTHQNQSARRKALTDDGQVVRTALRRATRSSSQAGVYRITDLGKRVLQDRERAIAEGRRWTRKSSGLPPRQRKPRQEKS